MRTWLRIVLLVLWAALLICGQETRATLLGRVMDPSEAVIPGVRVQATHQATGVPVSTRTNQEGLYQLPFLLPGIYTVTAEAAGFKTLVREGIELRINDRVELNLTMEVGAVGQRVEVVGETPLLQTATASLGQVIDRRRIQELPLIHGNPMAVLELTPGLAQARTSDLGLWGFRVFDNGWTTSFAIDGALSNTHEITLDGVSNTTRMGGGGARRNTVAYTPPADLVDEFKVQTASFDASVGYTSGAVINMSVKPGTNDFHGTAYYFSIRPELNANQWFANRAGQPRTEFKYHRWGGSATGPVFLPRIYSGRERTFFSYGYEGHHDAPPWPQTLTVPTPKQLAGDFFDLLALGSNYQIYDPMTARRLPNGRIQRDPFPGNIIPPDRMSAFTKPLTRYWAPPRTAGAADGTNNFPDPNQPDPNFYFSHVARIDYIIGETNRLYGRAAVSKNIEKNYRDAFKNEATGNSLVRRNRGFMIDDVHTFNARWVLDLRYGYMRFREDSEPKTLGFDLTRVGFDRALVAEIDPQAWVFPCFVVSGYANLGCNNPNKNATDNHDLGGGATAVMGTHTMKFGGEFRVYRRNTYAFGQAVPRLDFGTAFTRGPFDNSPAAPIGQGLASFLLGVPTGGFLDRNASYAEQSTGYAAYWHDDWKATRRLTLNLGLRYEYEGPLTERFNRTVRHYDFVSRSPIEEQVKAAYSRSPIPELPVDRFAVIGGLTFAGVGGNPRGAYEPNRKNFMPRAGLAYSLNPKTVLRAGYGIFYSYLGVRGMDVIQTGFSQRTEVIPSLDDGVTFRIKSLANPFIDGILNPPGASLGLATFWGRSISVFNPRPFTPYNQRWQFSVQRELPGRVVFDVGYVGNRGTHIEIPRNVDPVPNQWLSLSPVRDQARIDLLTALIPNPFYPLLPGTSLAGTTIPRSQLLRPYPHFASISDFTYIGFSWYHSLQLKVEKRFSSGLTFQSTYTWSKFMQATSFLNEGDTYPERVISDQDFPHRFSVSWIYELPFGRGKPLGSSFGGVASQVVSGWQIQGLYTLQSGQALGFGNAISSGNLKDIPLPTDRRSVDRWFNTDAGFERNPARQLAWNVRRFSSRFAGIRGDGINQWNLSTIKNFRIREGVRLQFRGEAINGLNHAQFQNPNTNPASAAFGMVTDEKSSGRALQLALKLLW